MDFSMNRDLLAGFETRQVADFRSNIQALEEKMLASDNQVELEVIHHFSDGIYARELRIPADRTITGKIHKTEHLNVLAKGTITVVTDEGRKTIEAPHVMTCPPNTKRAGYTHTDCVWITFHGTHERDLEKLEQELITPDYMSIEESQKIGD